MKKQTKKLNLSKRTISNLDATEMSNHLGGFNANARMKAAAKKPFTRNRTCWSF